MRIILGKKKLITLIVIVITLVIALSLLLYFFRDRIGFNFKQENKVSGDYSNVISECQSSTSNLDINYTCYAFIESITEENSEKCFTFSLITKDYSVKPIIYCYEEGEIEWDPESMTSWRSVPVSIDFLYKKSLSGTEFLQKISLEILEDNLTLDLVSKLYDNGYRISNFWTKSKWEVEQKKYYTQILSGDFFAKNVGVVTFLSSKIRMLEEGDSQYKLEIEAEINGKRILISTTTKDLYLLNSTSGDLVPKKLEGGLELNRRYDIAFFYIPSRNGIGINIDCTNLGDAQFDHIAFCENLIGRDLAEMEIPIDTYLNELSEYNLETVDKLIPYLIINNE